MCVRPIQLREAWRAHQPGEPDWKPLLESVSLPAEEAFLRLYPRNLSVGMAQRFLIAMALLHSPSLLLADEPTSALDTITQAEILALFRRLNQERGVGILYISHDLASVAALCSRVAILHQGQIAECAPAQEIFRTPRHPYTRKLIEAIPELPRREAGADLLHLGSHLQQAAGPGGDALQQLQVAHVEPVPVPAVKR